MQDNARHSSALLLTTALCWWIAASPALAQWVDFADQSASRIDAAPGNVLNDPEEKDYAWGDVDLDGDVDLVVVRKTPFTVSGKRPNLLLINDDGVLTDRTSEFAAESDVPGDNGFLTPTEDRDVALVDLDNDGWLDVVTAVTLSDGDPKAIGHPRVYRNLGCENSCSGTDDWLGFRHEDVRIPEMLPESLSPGFNPRFGAVATGDVNGDGYVDLYFVDHDESLAGGGGQPHNGDFNDRLLLNLGDANPGTFIDGTSGMFAGLLDFEVWGDAPFPLSGFGTSGLIADFNGDGLNDILKVNAYEVPFYVGIAYNGGKGPEPFSTNQVVTTVSPIFAAAADLNRDGTLDIVATMDGADRYFLNMGNDLEGKAILQTKLFQFTHVGSGGNASDDGFAGNLVVADLNRDGWDDVLTTNVADESLGGCLSGRVHLYRNRGANAQAVVQLQELTSGMNCQNFLGNPPQCLVSGIPSDTLEGTHDIAVFDIDGDGWLDMVLGQCGGTRVYINQPPAAAAGSIGSQLRLEREPEQPSELTLNWLPSCAASDSDYSVYQGSLDGGFDDPLPVSCSTAGNTSATFESDPGNRYYLVVPHNGTLEGSFGTDSAGTERSRGLDSCRPEFFQGCD